MNIYNNEIFNLTIFGDSLLKIFPHDLKPPTLIKDYDNHKKLARLINLLLFGKLIKLKELKELSEKTSKNICYNYFDNLEYLEPIPNNWDQGLNEFEVLEYNNQFDQNNKFINVMQQMVKDEYTEEEEEENEKYLEWIFNNDRLTIDEFFTQDEIQSKEIENQLIPSPNIQYTINNSIEKTQILQDIINYNDSTLSNLNLTSLPINNLNNSIIFTKQDFQEIEEIGGMTNILSELDLDKLIGDHHQNHHQQKQNESFHDGLTNIYATLDIEKLLLNNR